jgi:hypothetical protein
LVPASFQLEKMTGWRDVIHAMFIASWKELKGERL